MKIKSDNKHHIKILILILLTISTLVTYWQVRNHFFINYDDPMFVAENPHVQKGLNLETVYLVFTNPDYLGSQLSILSHMADMEFFGLDAGKHHVISVLFHIANILLLFSLLNRMTGEYWKSAFVAAIFGLHPINIESVAWIAERRNVLSTLFWLLTMNAYISYVKRPGMLRYGAILFFFILGLMSKPMLVTLPFVLLLMDYWPLRRFQAVNLKSFIHQIKPLLFEKFPLFAISILSIVGTFIAMKGEGGVIGIGGIVSFHRLSLILRIENIIVSYIKYICNMVWPYNLAVFYPYPKSIPDWQFFGALLLILFITGMAIAFFKKCPWLFVGWFWYLGTLIPVIGLVQIGSQAMADRYAYVPFVGLFLIIVWGVPSLVRRWRYKNNFLSAIAIIFLFILMTSTWYQLHYWKNSMSLFKHALKVTKDNDTAHRSLAMAFQEKGNSEKFAYHVHEAFKISPGNAFTQRMLGDLFAEQKNNNAAIEHYLNALRIDPKLPTAEFNLGKILLDQNRLHEALTHFRNALSLIPDWAEAHNNIGSLLKKMGKLSEAEKHCYMALKLKPNYAEAHNNLGNILEAQGQTTEAIKHFNKALHIKPDFYEVYNNLGATFIRNNNIDKAIFNYRKALELKPNSALLHKNLGDAFFQNNKIEEAIFHYRETLKQQKGFVNTEELLQQALQINTKAHSAIERIKNELEQSPDDPQLFYGLGNIYRQIGKFEKGLFYYKKALSIQPNFIKALSSLAITYSDLNQYDKSIESFKKIIEIQPEKESVYYNIACLYAKQEKLDLSIDYLKKALEKGYKNWELIKNDKDLENIRHTSEYRKIITGSSNS